VVAGGELAKGKGGAFNGDRLTDMHDNSGRIYLSGGGMAGMSWLYRSWQPAALTK